MTYTGGNIPKLGFGFMRLPVIEGDENATIDIEQVKRMVDVFMGAGFTYFDTARGYHGGKSEAALKRALIERYPRESFQVATKLPAWMAADAEEARSMFETSLVESGAGYFDFYLLHNLGESRSALFEDYGLWDFAREQKDAGLIRNLGFSFHDKADEFERILEAHPDVDFVQLQINYADWENPAIQSRACYEVARKHGKPVIIMEPVKGGMLATPPKSVEEILKKADPNASNASWAIRFAASLEGVITVLSGMSNIEQMEDNLSYMKDFAGLTEEQKNTLEAAQEEMNRIPLIPCTTCNYCAKVCPMDIGISGSFTAMNYLTLYGSKPAALHQENWLVGGHGKKRADQCIKCGACEAACPQHISIREELERVTEALIAEQ